VNLVEGTTEEAIEGCAGYIGGPANQNGCIILRVGNLAYEMF
jgi:hypothetical protein